MVMVTYYNIYYCVIVAWSLYYFVASFVSIPDLPWSTCGKFVSLNPFLKVKILNQKILLTLWKVVVVTHAGYTSRFEVKFIVQVDCGSVKPFQHDLFSPNFHQNNNSSLVSGSSIKLFIILIAFHPMNQTWNIYWNHQMSWFMTLIV